MTDQESPLPKLNKSSSPQVLVFMPCRSCVNDWKNCLVALFGWKSAVNWAKGLKLRCAFLFSNAEKRQSRSGCWQKLQGKFPVPKPPPFLFLEAMAPEPVPPRPSSMWIQFRTVIVEGEP